MSWTIDLVDNLDAWRRVAAQWDELSRGVPFRSFAWLATWWQHYGPAPGQELPRLFVLVVRDEAGVPVGFAPWYLTCSLGGGRVLAMLGTGEVYSDYLSVLAAPGRETEVAAALAHWLCGDGDNLWDIIDLTGIDCEDRATNALVDALAARSLTVQRRQGLDCWRLALPDSWEAYLDQLSKSHRKKIRKLERTLMDSGEIVAHHVTQQSQLQPAFELFAELHQRRWRSQGKPGCFGSPRFASFLTAVTPRLFETGRLRLIWLERAGSPIAADYMLVGNGVLYTYQGGIEPSCLELQPGRLALIVAIREAIGQGYRAYDFLRGSESYKAHFGAEPRPTVAIRIVSQRATARLRNHAWRMREEAKLWLKQKLLNWSSSHGAAGPAQPV